jgi:hypothetical protein
MAHACKSCDSANSCRYSKSSGQIRLQTKTEYGWWWSSGYDVVKPTIEGAIDYIKNRCGGSEYRVVEIPLCRNLQDSRNTPPNYVVWTGKGGLNANI